MIKLNLLIYMMNHYGMDYKRLQENAKSLDSAYRRSLNPSERPDSVTRHEGCFALISSLIDH